MGVLKKIKKGLKKTVDIISGKPLRQGISKLGDALIPDVPPLLGDGTSGPPQQVIVLAPATSDEDRWLTPTMVGAVGVTLLLVVLWSRGGGR